MENCRIHLSNEWYFTIQLSWNIDAILGIFPPNKDMPAAICGLFMLLKHLVKHIFPQPSSVLHTIPQSTWDQQGVHSALVSKPMVFYWQVLMRTTSWSCRVLESMSFSVQHPLVLLCLQFGQYESNSSQWYTVHLHQVVEIQYNSLDFQTHLKKPNHLVTPVTE